MIAEANGLRCKARLPNDQQTPDVPQGANYHTCGIFDRKSNFDALQSIDVPLLGQLDASKNFFDGAASADATALVTRSFPSLLEDNQRRWQRPGSDKLCGRLHACR
jgi:hypothetical protein